MQSVEPIIRTLSSLRLPLSNEKRLQEAIGDALADAEIAFEREVRLSAADVIDFMCHSIGIEVKIKGASKREIYRQVERYAQHIAVTELILVTNVAMGFPPDVKGKPVYVVNLAKAWL